MIKLRKDPVTVTLVRTLLPTLVKTGEDVIVFHR